MQRRSVLLGALSVATVGAHLPLSSVLAAAAPEAGKFVQGLGDRAVAVLADPQRTNAKIRAEFDRLLHEGFDLETIGRFVLGRYWNTTTPPQRDEYQKLFADM